MIILDTHSFVWLIKTPLKLSAKAKKEILKAQKEKEIFISSISAWEIALLVKEGKLNLGIEVSQWVEKLARNSAIHFIPVDNEIAIKSVNLVDFTNKDPADRIIVATAKHLGAKLITSDRRILKYKGVQAVW